MKIVLFLLILYWIAIQLKRKKQTLKGEEGESELYRHLEELEKENGCRILRNVYVPSFDGSHYTEIDMIVLSRHGMCVVECKNYKGKIVGAENDRDWKQIFPSKSYSFFNPIKQNAGHLHAIWDLCGRQIGFIPTWSVVAFADSCDISAVRYKEEQMIVTSFSEAKSAIEDMMIYSAAHMTDQNVELLYRTLKKYSKASARIKRRHRQYVRKQAGKNDFRSSDRFR